MSCYNYILSFFFELLRVVDRFTVAKLFFDFILVNFTVAIYVLIPNKTKTLEFPNQNLSNRHPEVSLQC